MAHFDSTCGNISYSGLICHHMTINMKNLTKCYVNCAPIYIQCRVLGEGEQTFENCRPIVLAQGTARVDVSRPQDTTEAE